MTRKFSSWISKQQINEDELQRVLIALKESNYDARLGAYLYKMRIRYKGRGKSGSGRSIICYKRGDRAIFLHGFSKNEKSSLSNKELTAFKALSKILISISDKDMKLAIKNGDFIEVK